MYLRGLKKLGLLQRLADGSASGGDYGDYGTDFPSAELPSSGTSQPTAYGDWINLGVQAMRTWGDVRKAEIQGKAQVAVAPYQARYGFPTYYTGSPIPAAIPGYSPFPGGVGSGSSLMWLAALGIGAFAIYNIAK